MSIGTPVGSDRPPRSRSSGHSPRPSVDGPAHDADLVRIARDEIQQLANEIRHIASSDVDPAQFFSEFLQRVVSALASVAGVVWQFDHQAEQNLLAQVNLSDSVLQAVIQRPEQIRLLQHVAESRRSLMVPPKSDGAGIRQANSSDCLLLLVPMVVDGQVMGIVQIFQRAGRGAATERGYQRFLEHTAAVACEYWKSHRLRQLAHQIGWSHELEAFVREIHRQLDLRETSYALVNECRRLIDCDRVSLALRVGSQCRIAAVSGLDNLDRRAAQVRPLEKLVSRIVRTGDTVWLSNNNEQLAPQIESNWNDYVDKSHVRQCGIVPLYAPQNDQHPVAGQAIGALIVESFSDTRSNSQQRQRVQQLARHSALAMTNALEHNNLFLMPVWRTLGKICRALGGHHYPKVLLFVIFVMAAGFALATIQRPFTLPVKGTLQPASQQTIFARHDGVILDVPVRHGDLVTPGQILVQMRNTDLEVEINTLSGQQTTTREQIHSTQRALLDNPRLGVEQQNQLSGKLLQLQQVVASTQKELDLVHEKQQELTLSAPQAGRIVTWQVRDALLHRPVQKGQALMAVVDPDADWELELKVPERHIGHLTKAKTADDQSTAVTFMLSSYPGQVFRGRLCEIDQTATSWDGREATVRVRVSIDQQTLPDMRSDATVMAKVNCGQCSLGYSWFYDLIDTMRGRVAFWLSW